MATKKKSKKKITKLVKNKLDWSKPNEAIAQSAINSGKERFIEFYSATILSGILAHEGVGANPTDLVAEAVEYAAAIFDAIDDYKKS